MDKTLIVLSLFQTETGFAPKSRKMTGFLYLADGVGLTRRIAPTEKNSFPDALPLGLRRGGIAAFWLGLLARNAVPMGLNRLAGDAECQRFAAPVRLALILY